jgi:centromere/kinetochore protein ZW10
MTQAQALQADIEKSRKLAGEIVKQAEADEEKLHALEDQETHLNFLEKEKLFNSQLYVGLQSIKRVHQLFDEAERLASERHILKALQKLAGGSKVRKFRYITNCDRFMGNPIWYSNR